MSMERNRWAEMILRCQRSVFTFVANIVSPYPIALIVACLTAAVLFASGNVFIVFGNDFRFGYSDPNSPSIDEHAVYRSFFNLQSNPYMMAIIGQQVNGESMLTLEAFEEMKAEVERGLSKDVKLDDTETTSIRKGTMRDFLIYSSETLFFMIEEALNYPNEKVEMGFPYAKLHGRYITTMRNFYGYDNGHLPMLSYIMVFYAEVPSIIDKVKRAEVEWNEELKARNESMVELRLLGDEILNEEILFGSIWSVPYFLVGTSLMMLFVFVTVSRRDQSVCQTLFLAFWTTLSPIIAGLMAIGIYAYAGTNITCAMFITPFLVLGVGVDDGFLMMHNWFASKELDGSLRLRSMLISTGPSVSLTSFTNVFAFLVGGYLSPPMVRSFCYCTALAMAFDWFFQLAVFAPALLKFHSFSFTLPHKENEGVKRSYVRYCEWLRMSATRILLFIALTFYWIWSVYFILQMPERFSPDKTLHWNSHIAKSLLWFERAFDNHEIFDVFVVNPPENSTQLLETVVAIRSVDYSCDNFTTWIETYDQEYHPEPGPLAEYFELLPSFLDKYPDLKLLVHFTYTEEGTLLVRDFTFGVCVHGRGTWDKRAVTHEDLRTRLPDGFSLYNYDATLFDVILATQETTVQTCMVTLICMIIMCAICIPSLRATPVATLCVISITVGIVGGLGAWGADMDTIVMVNVVMSIGLAVDYTAHITYNYFKTTDAPNNVERMAISIEAVAHATAQAAITTMLCAVPLYFYDVYMFVTFAKTISLCTLLGYIHAVLIIPMLLLFFDGSIVGLVESV